jgi:hypothetical protein
VNKGANGPCPTAVRRIPWAELFRRVFRIDVLQCERCGGKTNV